MNQVRVGRDGRDREELKERLQQGMARAQDGVVRFDTQLQRFVRSQPLAAAAAALAVGFVIGRIFSRR